MFKNIDLFSSETPILIFSEIGFLTVLTNVRNIRDYLLAAYVFLLGKTRKDWEKLTCWMDLKEEDYWDLELENQEEVLRLTYELRQKEFVTSKL